MPLELTDGNSKNKMDFIQRVIDDIAVQFPVVLDPLAIANETKSDPAYEIQMVEIPNSGYSSEIQVEASLNLPTCPDGIVFDLNIEDSGTIEAQLAIDGNQSNYIIFYGKVDGSKIEFVNVGINKYIVRLTGSNAAVINTPPFELIPNLRVFFRVDYQWMDGVNNDTIKIYVHIDPDQGFITSKLMQMVIYKEHINAGYFEHPTMKITNLGMDQDGVSISMFQYMTWYASGWWGQRWNTDLGSNVWSDGPDSIVFGAGHAAGNWNMYNEDGLTAV